MKGFTIDLNKCQRDGICGMVCPAGVIKVSQPGGYPEPTPEFEKFCLACGHCVSVCPVGAFSLDWLAPESCPPINSNLTLTPEQVEQLLRSRRSIRNFKKELVEQDKLNKLLEIATYASSAKNEQPWHWLVISNPAEVKQLAGLAVNWIRLVIKEEPNLAREKGYPRIIAAWKKGKDPICREAPHLIIGHGDKNWFFGPQDFSIALTYIELFAPALGLGTCWAGYFYSAANFYPPLLEALNIPDNHKVFGALMVGYPKFKYHRLPLRNPARITWK